MMQTKTLLAEGLNLAEGLIPGAPPAFDGESVECDLLLRVLVAEHDATITRDGDRCSIEGGR